MHLLLSLWLVPLLHTLRGLAAPPIEPPNFDVVQALEDNGVDVAAIPELANLTERSENAACTAACGSLRLLYGQDNVLYEGSAPYDSFTASYWSALQGEVNPFCIFKPGNSQQISVLVLLARLTRCPFAVKSGGHGAFPGASSLEGGITVSFERMKSISVSGDRKIASVEPGNTWGPLYTNLSAQELTVIGGRVYEIGTGGLTTGGGISFFSNRRGWACDNVVSYEVVTATGLRITVSATQYPDLYYALRGGGNNFGIVTKFNYAAFDLPGGQVWGGSRAFLELDFSSAISAFTELADNAKQDLDAGQWLSWAQVNGTKIASAELYYGKVDGNLAPIFSDWNAITPISDDTANRRIEDYAAKIQSGIPEGQRQLFYSMAIENTEEINTIAKDIYFEEIQRVIDLPGAFPVMTYQSITIPQLENMQKNGGNALGLTPADGVLTLILINFSWTRPEDDNALYTAASNTFKRTKAEAVARGLNHDYVYMNYAAQFQDVIASYGADNKSKLKAVARRYDPTGVFQTLTPGYFKLDRAATPGTDFFSF